MKKGEVFLYQQDKGSSSLALLYLVFNTVLTILCLNKISIDMRIISFILGNIVLSFVGFLISTSIKRYDKKWAYVGLAVGVFQLLRLIFIPNMPSVSGANEYIRIIIIISLILSGIFMIMASLLSLYRCKLREEAKKSLQGA